MAHIATHARHAPLRRRASLLNWLLSLIALRRQRINLSTLEPHLLEDIGVTPHEAASEAKRPVWDVPQTWRV